MLLCVYNEMTCKGQEI